MRQTISYLARLAALGLALAPVGASADERADIEAACLALGLNDCACIAGHTMEYGENLRTLVLQSLQDPADFDRRTQAGEFSQQSLRVLASFQAEVQRRCVAERQN